MTVRTLGDMSLRPVALAALAACSLVLAACGGSSSDSSSAETDQGAAVVETVEPAGTVA